jgi:RNA-directed DNA polymerase
VPQGGPLSPLLSNILLDDLDKELEKRGHQFCRYADDLIILVKSQRSGERVMESISRFLEKKLKVQVNRDKSQVVRAEKSIFLGFTFTNKRLTVSEKALTKCKNELRHLTWRSWGVAMEYRYKKIRTYVQGWMNYFGIGMRYNTAAQWDQWFRRRIRMCYPATSALLQNMKAECTVTRGRSQSYVRKVAPPGQQWRRTRKRVGELMKLGVGERHAVTAGLSRKAYWHLAKTEAINVGLSNTHLTKQGLTSMRTLWIKMHHPATAR